MIKNKIIEIYPDTIEDITAKAKAKNFYLVNLDGRTIHNEQDYIKAMYKEFVFPHWDDPEWRPNYDGYMDWIRDLGWLQDEGYKGFGLIIDYYKSFLANEPVGKHQLKDWRVVHTFKEYLELEGFNAITHYWEFEVIKYGGDDMPHSFNIYLVDR